MASSKEFVQYVADQMSEIPKLLIRPMFGEYGIYSEGKIFALICDDKLFFKPTRAAKKYIGEVVECPPYIGAKPYYLIEEGLEDMDWLKGLINTTLKELPLPKKKNRKSGMRRK